MWPLFECGHDYKSMRCEFYPAYVFVFASGCSPPSYKMTNFLWSFESVRKWLSPQGCFCINYVIACVGVEAKLNSYFATESKNDITFIALTHLFMWILSKSMTTILKGGVNFPFHAVKLLLLPFVLTSISLFSNTWVFFQSENRPGPTLFHKLLCLT